MLANAPKTEQGRITVFLPQQLPFHAEYGIDDLLLLASHGEKASGQLGWSRGWACRAGRLAPIAIWV
jgi:hypothetical protein